MVGALTGTVLSLVLTDVFVYCNSALRIGPLLYLDLLSVRSFFTQSSRDTNKGGKVAAEDEVSAAARNVITVSECTHIFDCPSPSVRRSAPGLL